MNRDTQVLLVSMGVGFCVYFGAILLDKFIKYIVTRPNARIVHRPIGFIVQYRVKYGIIWHYFENSFGNIEVFNTEIDARIFIETYFSSIEAVDKNKQILQPTKYFRI